MVKTIVKKVHQVKSVRDMEKNMIGYKMGSSTTGVLHYDQDFFGGELQRWMKN